ncbi:MAG: PQQ-binding-like beta-propeller repeat protein, partial [Planctomycetaceae bacterium]|nr:PQQ-binding-like beta-propeller repeat protein [Planctomycetaceae bacterium]
TSWPGAMNVPFFASPNGSWIRSTPALDENRLYVAGMRDVLVCLEGQTGKILWQVDFVEKLGTPLPAFGFASSPLIDGNAIFVQAGASFIKLDKNTGEILWRTLEDAGGMMGSAFSSPVIATIAGQRQLLVQTRLKLAGVDLESGAVLWEQEVPNFRGMNILTPVPYRDGVFTSSYQNKAWLYGLTRDQDAMTVKEQWTNNAQAYMSTPVLIDGHVYLHLQNQRFTCINLETGERTWTSEPFGKYCSLVAQGNRILALDERGILLLIAANPAEFQLISEHQVSEEETWAHLAVYNDKLIIRELNGISCFNWSDSTPAE